MRKIVAVIVVVAVIAAFFALRRPQAPAQVAGAHAPGSAVRWPLGRAFTYALSWRATTSGEVAPGEDGKSQGLALESSVEGAVTLERIGGTDKLAQVALQYARIDKFALAMHGHDAGGDGDKVSAALVGQPAFLAIDSSGRIESIAFPQGMAPGVASMLRALAVQVGYTLGEGAWEADEEFSLGEAHVRYRSSGADIVRQPLSFKRIDAVQGALDGATDLRGGTSLTLDDDGLPLAIEETIDAAYTRRGSKLPAIHSSWNFALHRSASGVSDGRLARLAQAPAQPLRAQVADGDRSHRQDLRQAQGMSTESIFNTLDRYQRGAKPDRQFLVKAAAWLRLHPEDLGPLVHEFASGERTLKGRGLILDLFAEAGDAHAQAAMRAALGSPSAHARDKDFSRLVQRFTFVVAPDKESVAWVERAYEASRSKSDEVSAMGAAVALGSMVRRLHYQHDDAEAQRVNALLRGELRSAETSTMRYALVAALGNAARNDDVPDLLAVSSDPDVRVRSEVASALARTDTPDARAGLLTLVTDTSSAVSSASFASLKEQSLDDSDWRALADVAQGARSPSASDSALVDLVREKKAATRDEGRAILTALLKRNQSPDSDLPEIIRSLLASKG